MAKQQKGSEIAVIRVESPASDLRFTPVKVIDAALEDIKRTLDPLVAAARDHQVRDDGTHREAIDLLVRIKAQTDDVEARRVEWKAPVLEAVRVIDGAAKRAVGDAIDVSRALNQKASAWKVADEDRRNRELEAQRAREQEVQRAATAAAEKAGLPAPVIVPRPAPPEAAGKVAASVGGSGTLRQAWRFDLINVDPLMGRVTIDLVEFAADPKNSRKAIVERLKETLRASRPMLFDLSDKRVQKLIDAGERDLPGLRVYQQASTSISTKV